MVGESAATSPTTKKKKKDGELKRRHPKRVTTALKGRPMEKRGTSRRQDGANPSVSGKKKKKKEGERRSARTREKRSAPPAKKL